MKKIKVIQINTSSSSGLVEDYKNDIFRNWNAQVGFQVKEKNKDINVECWTIEKEYDKEVIVDKDGVKFRVFPTSFSLRQNMEISMDMIKALKKEIEKSKKERYKLVLHFHEYHAWQVYLILFSIKKDKNIRIIAQHHGGRSPFKNMMKYKRFLLFLPGVAFMQFCERILYKKIDLFYSLSDDEDKYLSKIVPKSRIKFQTMGISDEYFKKGDKIKSRKKLKLNQKKKYVLFVGRIKTTKGIKELLDAMKKINDSKIQLLLMGQGTDSKKYEDYIKQNKINNVEFLGAKYGEDKLNYLSAADCLILPSHTEGAPVVLMEAIAKNLPVIATRVGGIPKMMKNNREGLIIPVQSEIDIAKSIKNILSWENKDISQYGKKYKWDEIIKNTIKDYFS